MLFILDNSLLDNFEENPDTHEAIHRSFESMRLGFHLVFGEDELLSGIINSENYSQSDRSIATKLLLHRSQMKSILMLRYYVRISNSTEVKKNILPDGRIELNVPPKFYVNSLLNQKSIFLPENISDIDLLIKISRAVLYEKKLNINLSYFPVNGGGSTTFEVYNIYQRENNVLCLAYVDSDKEFPEDHIHETARRIVRQNRDNVDEDSERILCELMINKAREIENILPSNILNNLCENDTNRIDFANFLQGLEDKKKDSKLYLDIKNGIDYKLLITSMVEMGFDYWDQLIGDKLSNCHMKDGFNCFENGCNCFRMTGLGNLVMSHAGTYLQRTSNQKMNEYGKSNPEVYKVWEELSTFIISWFCGGSPLYSS